MQDVNSEEHVVRYASPRHVDNEAVNGSAFLLRPHDDGALSINRPIIFHQDTSEALVEIRKLARIELKKSGRFAELNVGKIKAAIIPRSLNVIEDPLAQTDQYPADPSHAVIKGLPQGDCPLAEEYGDILSKCVDNVHLALL